MSKPDFNAMSKTDLRNYVLAHREDAEAFQALAKKINESPGIEVFSEQEIREAVQQKGRSQLET